MSPIPIKKQYGKSERIQTCRYKLDVNELVCPPIDL